MEVARQEHVRVQSDRQCSVAVGSMARGSRMSVQRRKGRHAAHLVSPWGGTASTQRRNKEMSNQEGVV